MEIVKYISEIVYQTDLFDGIKKIPVFQPAVRLYLEVHWSPDFSNLQGKRKLVREVGEFEKVQCLTEERERLLVRVIGRFEKMKVRDIGIPL